MSRQLTATVTAKRDPRLGALRLLIIVPALNEEHSLPAVIREIRAVDPAFEIIVIDDGSADGTARAGATAGAIVVRMPFNVGIGGAVQTGYQYALERGVDLAVQVDGDGQHDPREIPRLLEPLLDERADMVVGSRFAPGGGRVVR